MIKWMLRSELRACKSLGPSTTRIAMTETEPATARTRPGWLDAGERRWIALDHVTQAKLHAASLDARVRVEIHLDDGSMLTLVGSDALRFLDWLAGGSENRNDTCGYGEMKRHARHWRLRDPS